MYEFTFNSSKAPLSKKVTEFLRSEMEIDTGVIYHFALTNLELMDVDSGTSNQTPVEEEQILESFSK